MSDMNTENPLQAQPLFDALAAILPVQSTLLEQTAADVCRQEILLLALYGKPMHVSMFAPWKDGEIIGPPDYRPSADTENFAADSEAYDQAQQEMLFTGWKCRMVKANNGVEWVGVYQEIHKDEMVDTIEWYDHNTYWLRGHYRSTLPKPKNLGDFISDCNRAGIRLRWNPYNKEVQGALGITEELIEG